MLKKVIIENPAPGIDAIAYYHQDILVQMDVHAGGVYSRTDFPGIAGDKVWTQLLRKEPRAYVPMVKKIAEMAAGVFSLDARNTSVPFFMARALAWDFLVNGRGFSLSQARNTFGDHSLSAVGNAIRRVRAGDLYLTTEERMIKRKFDELIKYSML